MTNDPVPARGGTDPRWRLSPTKVVVGLILLVGIVAPLLVGTYASVEPRLFGFPAFYWLQFSFIFVGVATTSLVYQMTRKRSVR